MRPRLHIGTGGWVVYKDEHLPGVNLRFEDQDGRLRAVQMFWAPDTRITPDLLRALPLGQIEEVVNRPRAAKELRAALDEPGPDLRDIVSHFTAHASSMDVVPRRRLTPAVAIPEGRRYPDSFYREVARLYGELATEGRAARQIAEASGVPESTAIRWVKEARRRGFLPPGRRGKAG